MQYKVLLPTNGFEKGQVIELTEAEAYNFNAGEAFPRVELVKGQEAIVEPAVEAPKEPEATTTPAEEAKEPEAPVAEEGAPAETNV